MTTVVDLANQGFTTDDLGTLRDLNARAQALRAQEASTGIIGDQPGPASQQWRKPRLRVLANGQEVNGAVSATVTQNSWNAAGRFEVEVALGADPGLTYSSYWDRQELIEIDVQMALLGDGAPEGSGSWQSMIQGEVDQMRLAIQHNTLRIEGRDLTARLRDTKIQEAFSNKTASEIAEVIAGRHGLQAHVTRTSTLVGQYYQLEHDKITLGNFHRETTEWDLLVYLAQYEGAENGGFDVFIENNTLYFQPRIPPDQDPFTIRYQKGSGQNSIPIMNVTSLQMEHSLILARDVQVTVKTWNSKRKTPFTKIIKAQGTHRGGGTQAPAQNYVLILPNKTPDEALKIGQAYLSELTKHERVIHVTMPGDVLLTPRNMVQLVGTGTTFDISYYISEIERTIDFEGGFTQRVLCKNSSPRSQVTVS